MSEPVGEFDDLGISRQRGIDDLLRHGILRRNLTALTRLGDPQFGIDGGDVPLSLDEQPPEGAHVIHEQATLGCHLGTVPRAQGTRQVVERLTAGSQLRHVFLKFLLERVTTSEPFRAFLIDHVIEKRRRHRVEDLGDILRVLRTQADLHHL